MTKTEYTAAIAANQTAISALRADLRKLRAIEKLTKSFPDLKLVDASVLESSITTKKSEVQKLRAELSKARRIVKRMAEIEDIEAGKASTSKAKKTEKKSDKADGAPSGKNSEGKKTRAEASGKRTVRTETAKSGQHTPIETPRNNPPA